VLRATLVRSGADYDLEALAENATDAPLSISFPDRCPQGPVQFHGLGSDYDYYRSCTKGACMGPREPVRFSLQPHEKRTIASVQLSPRGGNCVAPLAPGHYEIAPIAPEHERKVCVVAAQLDVPARASARAPKASDPYACETPGDCVLSCPEARGCCGFPCGCKHAIHRDHRAAFERDYPRTCERAPCPAMGCAYEPAASATCHNGRCIASEGLGGLRQAPR
jgi:hypothetical protein